MALTYTEKKRAKMGNAYAVLADITFDSSYPTNGEALAASVFGLNSIDIMLCETAGGYMFQYDYANAKLKAFYPRAALTGSLDVADTAATLTGDTDVAAAAGAEVGNTVDLHTVTVRVVAIGI